MDDRSASTNSEPSPGRWRRRALSFAFWSLLALSGGLSSALSSLAEGNAHPWWRAFAWNGADFYLWLLFSPLVVRLGRSTAGKGARRELAVHLPGSFLVAAAQSTLLLLAYAWLRPTPTSADASLAALFRMEFAYALHLGLIIYWVILVVSRGWESRRRLEAERLRTSRLEGQLVHARLQALRTQLQPHFLFNTLNAISALTLADPTLARTMLVRLSDLLRLTLEDRDARTVPLARELELLQAYLAIQQVRFQDRLTIRVDFPEETLGASVPQLLLQPVVENALQHGLLPRPGRGTLTVTSRREGNALAVTVEDDGSGLAPGEVREGIGLRNTRARLRAISESAAELALHRRPEGGTRVELRLPFEEHRR